MKRRIGDAGKAFSAVLDEFSRELAISLLADASIAIDEIAFLLGYDDASSFYRSLKNWKKTSPRKWRKDLGF